ncbi:LysR family transcriptional regulator [Acidisoma cellulosilytica]|uniref:LysR family transcriptional regulator n=1 Tax=Acidisoma cellulosilyticum TaxID=2802395 RepID=A0A963Z107_9PROT|nr:LysR substrate-binding domain-containing protein [Acidisoma cellulosilyticum]MCB8880539.1 LysR family transcriptional regulator [Acidisoma cellulosilyticum]
MRRALNLNWVRSFEASARLLSFTKAALELGLTQAGVSQHMRMLEQQLGERLFVRLPRAVRLTDAGEAYLRVVRESLERLRLGTSDIFGSGSEGAVRLRAEPGFVSYWLAPRIKAFLSSYPEISLQIAPFVQGIDTDWDEFDIEVSFDSDRMPGLDAIALMDDPIFPVCGPQIAGCLNTPKDLATEHLLHVAGQRRGWSEWLALAKIVPHAETSVLQIDSMESAMAFAEQGIGVALSHGSFVEPLLKQGRLVRPFPAPLETIGIFYLITPSAFPLRRQARLFRDWLLAEGAKTAAI